MSDEHRGWYTRRSFFLSVTLPVALTVVAVAAILLWVAR